MGLASKYVHFPWSLPGIGENKAVNPSKPADRMAMKCKKHPEREAIARCQKHETGFCGECCECLNIDHCCDCIDPKLYCKFRTQCVIWEMSRDRRKKEVNGK